MSMDGAPAIHCVCCDGGHTHIRRFLFHSDGVVDTYRHMFVFNSDGGQTRIPVFMSSCAQTLAHTQRVDLRTPDISEKVQAHFLKSTSEPHDPSASVCIYSKYQRCVFPAFVDDSVAGLRRKKVSRLSLLFLTQATIARPHPSPLYSGAYTYSYAVENQSAAPISFTLDSSNSAGLLCSSEQFVCTRPIEPNEIVLMQHLQCQRSATSFSTSWKASWTT